MPFSRADDMDSRSDFVRRIVSRSGIFASRERQDLERELHAHLADAMEHARSLGCDEGCILEIVCDRFGDPDEIGREFAMTNRLGRRAISMLHSIVLLGISMA